MQLTEEQIEKLRQSEIRLDAEGRFWHEGAEVTHAGMREAFYRWLDRNLDGRYVLRLDERRFVYLNVDDAPYSIRSLRWVGDRAFLRVSDDVEEELNYSSLHLREGIAYCQVQRKEKQFDARFSTAAWNVLADHIRADEAGVALAAAGRYFAIGSR